MEMFLMALCLSLLGVALTSIAFAAATRPSREAQEAKHEVKPVVESAPAAGKVKIELWPNPGDDFEIMKRIKGMFDPGNLLNRGRLYGRL